MVKTDGVCLESPQGKTADGAVVAVREGAVPGIHRRQRLLDSNLLEGVEIEQVGACSRICVCQCGHCMLADDDHRDALPCCDQVVHYVAHHALGGPSGLILAGTVHQVEHRETPFRFRLILRREINVVRTVRAGQF